MPYEQGDKIKLGRMYVEVEEDVVLYTKKELPSVVGALRGVKFVSFGQRCAFGYPRSIDGIDAAHAHPDGLIKGTICFFLHRKLSDLIYKPLGAPMPVVLHEAAHLAVRDEGHSASWKKAFARLLEQHGYGGPYPLQANWGDAKVLDMYEEIFQYPGKYEEMEAERTRELMDRWHGGGKRG